MKANQKMHATYFVVPGWGYGATLFCNGKVVNEVREGDSRQDSSVFGTGEIPEKDLLKYAQSAAHEMLVEAGGDPRQVGYDEDGERAEREEAGCCLAANKGG